MQFAFATLALCAAIARAERAIDKGVLSVESRVPLWKMFEEGNIKLPQSGTSTGSEGDNKWYQFDRHSVKLIGAHTIGGHIVSSPDRTTALEIPNATFAVIRLQILCYGQPKSRVDWALKDVVAFESENVMVFYDKGRALYGPFSDMRPIRRGAMRNWQEFHKEAFICDATSNKPTEVSIELVRPGLDSVSLGQGKFAFDDSLHSDSIPVVAFEFDEQCSDLAPPFCSSSDASRKGLMTFTLGKVDNGRNMKYGLERITLFIKK